MVHTLYFPTFIEVQTIVQAKLTIYPFSVKDVAKGKAKLGETGLGGTKLGNIIFPVKGNSDGANGICLFCEAAKHDNMSLGFNPSHLHKIGT